MCLFIAMTSRLCTQCFTRNPLGVTIQKIELRNCQRWHTYTLNGPSHETIFKNVTADRLFIFSKTKCMFNKWMKINPLNGFTRINLKSFFFMRNYLFWYIFPFVLKHSSLSSSEFVHKGLSHVIFYSLYSRLWFKKKKKKLEK